MGTTWTRFRNWLDASLLTMTAGRRLRISPPSDGSKLTHQASPRLIRHVPDGRLGPCMSFGFPLLLPSHVPIDSHQVLPEDVRPDQRLDELADPLPSHDPMETLIDLFVHGDSELLVHRAPPDTYLIRISYVSHTYLSPALSRRSRTCHRLRWVGAWDEEVSMRQHGLVALAVTCWLA